MRGQAYALDVFVLRDKADRRIGRKTTSGNGQAWSLPSPRRQWKTEKNGGNWL